MMTLVASAEEAWSAKPVAIKGSVSVVNEEGQSEPLTLKSKIHAGDKIVATAGSIVQLFLADGTLVTLRDAAEMTIRKFSQDEKNSGVELEVLKGAYRICAGAIAQKNPEKFKLVTPDGEFVFDSCLMNGKRTMLFLEGKVEQTEIRVIPIGPIRQKAAVTSVS